mgnify:CR=1 FL=1
MEIVYYLTENQGSNNKSPVTSMDFLNSLFYQLLELSSFPSELSMNCWFRALFNQFNLKKESHKLHLSLANQIKLKPISFKADEQ